MSQVATSCLPRWPHVPHPTQVHPTQRRVSAAFAPHPRPLLVLSVLWVWAILTGAQWCLFVVCVLFLWAITRQSSSCGQATSQMGTQSLWHTANCRGSDFCLENSQSPEAHGNRRSGKNRGAQSNVGVGRAEVCPRPDALPRRSCLLCGPARPRAPASSWVS